jgi:hypothetical protein
MSETGWVYVITNEGMPGLVKVGFSTRDPSIRAGELHHTNNPFPFNVAYKVMLENPYLVEQDAHGELSDVRVEKSYSQGVGVEWFRCNVEQAIYAIKKVSYGKNVFHEEFVEHDAKERFQQEQKEREQTEARNKKIQDYEKEVNRVLLRMKTKEETINKKYDNMARNKGNGDNGAFVVIIDVLCLCLGLSMIEINIILGLSVICGLVFINHKLFDGLSENNSHKKFPEIEEKREKELSMIINQRESLLLRAKNLFEIRAE